MNPAEPSRPLVARAPAVRGVSLDGLRAQLRLLSPRYLGARNRLRRMGRAGRIQLGILTVLGMGFGTAIYLFFLRVLHYFLEVPDFGPVLTYKLLGMVFVTFFSVLLFSNIVTSLSTFFLARDLDRLMAAPLSAHRFFTSRFLESLIESSWMMVLFALPAFLAYGVAHGAGPSFYLVTAATLVPFLMIPAALGVITTVMLVNIFPARRTKDILVVLSIVMVAVLYMMFRMLQPERLVNPEAFANFVEFIGAMRAPSSPYLPSTWATEIVFPFLGSGPSTVGFHALLLATTAAVGFMAAEAITARWYLSGWTKAQEGRRARLTRGPLWERALALITRPLSPHTRLLVGKEVKTFFRDTSQWSQLILLLALVVVYVYNFSVLPIKGSPLVTFYFKNVIAFVNLALAGFVTAAVAVRFVFPSISLEGRAFWILKTAPLRLRRVWWTKFWAGLLPLLTLGEALVILTNSYLRVMPVMMWLSTVTLFLMMFGIVSLGLAVGVTYPRFDADNATKVAAGPGGLIYMVLCMSFIGLVVVLEAWPVYVLFASHLSGQPLSPSGWAGVVASLAAVVAVSLATFIIPMRRGLRRLEQLEV